MAHVSAGERRQQAVTEARRILETDGLGAVTLRRVARGAGMTLSSLQWAVRSKEELLGELFLTINAEIDEIVDGAVAPCTTLDAAIRAVLLALWRSMEHAPMAEVGEAELVIESLRRPAQRAGVRDLFDAYVDSCARALARASATSQTVPAVPVDQLARLMVVALEGLVMLFLASGDGPRCRDDLAVLASALSAVAAGRVAVDDAAPLRP